MIYIYAWCKIWNAIYVLIDIDGIYSLVNQKEL